MGAAAEAAELRAGRPPSRHDVLEVEVRVLVLERLDLAYPKLVFLERFAFEATRVRDRFP